MLIDPIQNDKTVTRLLVARWKNAPRRLVFTVVDAGGVLVVATGSAAEVEVAPGTSYATPLGALDDAAATRSPLVTSIRGCPKACFAKLKEGRTGRGRCQMRCQTATSLLLATQMHKSCQRQRLTRGMPRGAKAPRWQSRCREPIFVLEKRSPSNTPPRPGD
jgi:hypothetical protein